VHCRISTINTLKYKPKPTSHIYSQTCADCQGFLHACRARQANQPTNKNQQKPNMATFVVVNWLVQAMLNTAALMLVQLAHKPTKPTKPTNLTDLDDLDDQHVGWLTVQWAGSGKPVGQYGGFQILDGHTVVDLLKWLAQQDEKLVDARLFVGQGGPEVEVDDVASSADSTNLAKWACTHGLIGLSSLTKLDGLVGMNSLVVTGGVLHQAVQSNVVDTSQQSSCLRRRLLRACERRWCSLTAGWAETVLCQVYLVDCRAFAKLASLVVNKHIQCKQFGSQRQLVAALKRLDWISCIVYLQPAALAALVKAHLEDSEVVVYSCNLLRRFDEDSTFCLVVPDLLSRLNLPHCVVQLAQCFGWFGLCDINRRHFLDVALQIAASVHVPVLAELASKPADYNCDVGIQNRISRAASCILKACAKHICAKDLSTVVLAGWNGRHYHLLSELAKHHNDGCDEVFFAAEGPQLALKHFMDSKHQTGVSKFLLSIWKSEQAAWNYQHGAWACFGASIRDMWDNQYRLDDAGERVVWHLLRTNIHVRKAFANSQPKDLAKQILENKPPSWLEHQIRCALSYIKD
jgi:hypothetical protein